MDQAEALRLQSKIRAIRGQETPVSEGTTFSKFVPWLSSTFRNFWGTKLKPELNVKEEDAKPESDLQKNLEQLRNSLLKRKELLQKINKSQSKNEKLNQDLEKIKAKYSRNPLKREFNGIDETPLAEIIKRKRIESPKHKERTSDTENNKNNNDNNNNKSIRSPENLIHVIEMVNKLNKERTPSKKNNETNRVNVIEVVNKMNRQRTPSKKNNENTNMVNIIEVVNKLNRKRTPSKKNENTKVNVIDVVNKLNRQRNLDKKNNGNTIRANVIEVPNSPLNKNTTEIKAFSEDLVLSSQESELEELEETQRSYIRTTPKSKSLLGDLIRKKFEESNIEEDINNTKYKEKLYDNQTILAFENDFNILEWRKKSRGS